MEKKPENQKWIMVKNLFKMHLILFIQPQNQKHKLQGNWVFHNGTSPVAE